MTRAICIHHFICNQPNCDFLHPRWHRCQNVWQPSVNFWQFHTKTALPKTETGQINPMDHSVRKPAGPFSQFIPWKRCYDDWACFPGKAADHGCYIHENCIEWNISNLINFVTNAEKHPWDQCTLYIPDSDDMTTTRQSTANPFAYCMAYAVKLSIFLRWRRIYIYACTHTDTHTHIYIYIYICDE